MDDLISRQEILSIFKRWAAVPDYNEAERNIINAVIYVVQHAQHVESVGDAISRQAAIGAIVGMTTMGIEELANAGNKERFDWIKGLSDSLVKIINLPSVQPEIIRCRECKYAEVADKEDTQDGYTCQFHRGSIWFSGSYCSWAERRGEQDGNQS